MSLRRKRLAVLSAGAALAVAVAAAPAANAAAGSAATRTAPDTVVVSCASSYWVKILYTLGASCYSGNGIIIVNLPGTYQAQVKGLHDVCLLGAGVSRCILGPATVRFTPPINVREIEIRNP
jgi:hypothetical protein